MGNILLRILSVYHKESSQDETLFLRRKLNFGENHLEEKISPPPKIFFILLTHKHFG